MDQVYDALNAELPYDRCSNEINSSIMLYKDGQDKGLSGGQSDTNDKRAIVERFYARLKAELEEVHGSPNNHTIINKGTQIGRFAFNDTNDVVETTESLSEDSQKSNSADVIDVIFDTYIKPAIGECSGMDKFVTDLVTKIKKIKKFDPPHSIAITDKLKSNKTFLKDIFVQIDKDKRTMKSVYAPSLADLNSFLRDSLIATSTISSSYADRYIGRYNCLNGAIDTISNVISAMISYTNSDTYLKSLKKFENDILKKFDSALKISENNDPFVFKLQPYNTDLNTMTVYPISDDIDYGSSVSDYINAKGFNDIANTGTNVKCIFTSIRGYTDSKTLKDKLYSSDIIGSGKIKLNDSKNHDIDLLDFVGDMTIGEFYTQVEKYISNVSSINKLFEATIKCFEIISSSFKTTKTALTKLSAVLNKYSKPDRNKNIKIIKMFIQFCIEIGLDAITTTKSMLYCNMIDNVRKLLLVDLTDSFINIINTIIKQSLGE